MARVLTVGLVGLFLLTATGCGNSPDGLVKSLITDMNRLADSMEKGEPEDKQKAIAERLKATGEKLEKLNLTAEQKKALQDKHKDEMEKALGRLFGAAMKQGAAKAGAGGLDLGKVFGK